MELCVCFQNFLEPMPYILYFVVINTKLACSLFLMILLSFHQPVSSLARVAISLLLPYVSVEHEMSAH